MKPFGTILDTDESDNGINSRLTHKMKKPQKRQERKPNREQSKIIKRNFRAEKKMDEYFYEAEKMTREPALCNQLVSQYMIEEEQRMRNTDTNDTFVGIMSKNIDHDQFRTLQEHHDDEKEGSDDGKLDDYVKVEQEPDDVASSSRKFWGDDNLSKPPNLNEISDQNREYLREVMGTLHSNFMSGSDKDFEYTTVDQNADYDDLAQKNRVEDFADLEAVEASFKKGDIDVMRYLGYRRYFKKKDQMQELMNKFQKKNKK